MEVVFSILPFPRLLSEKYFSISPMGALLANHNSSQTPAAWSTQLIQNDPLEAYIVFDLAHFKERSLKTYQHEFLWLRVRRRNDAAEQDSPFFLLKVERIIRNHTVLARLGLWGEAIDSVTVLNPNTRAPHTLDTSAPHAAVRLRHYTWLPNQAPSLRRVAAIVENVNILMPTYHLSKASCYSFSRAITETVHSVYGVANQPQPQPRALFTRRTRFFGCFPTLTYKTRSVARKATQIAQAERQVCRLVSSASTITLT